MNNINHGGVAINIENTTPHKQIPLTISLQAIAVWATLQKAITVRFLIYLHQRHTTRTYFSAHCPVTAGGISMRIADNGATGGGSATEAQSLCLLNGSSTYLHPATGSVSSIDISFSDPSLFLDFTLQVLRRTCHVKCQTSRAGY